MRIHPIAKALVAIDQIADFIPIISTITNLEDISQKIIMDLGKMISHQKPSENYYYKNLDQKSYWQCMCGLIPAFGNAIIGSIKIYDRHISVKEIKLGDISLASGDKEGAVSHFRIAAEKGNTAALYKLGTCEEDESMREYYFMKAAESGNTDALIELVELGDIYFCKMRGSGEQLSRQDAQYSNARNPDCKRAFELYQKAAQLGSARSMFALGRLYALGLGVIQNNAEAVKLFKNAADNGDPNGLFTYGTMLQTGKLGFDKDEYEDEVIEVDQSEAIKYFEKAAEKGYFSAFLHLAKAYKKGLGVEKDLKKAQEYQMLYDKAISTYEPTL